MKRPYEITDNEFWALDSLLFLPVTPGSILAQWLTEFGAPPIDAVIVDAIASLQKKGYIGADPGKDSIPDDLVESLFVLAISNIRITAAIHRNGKFTWTNFGQLEETIIQYQISDNSLMIHPPQHIKDLPVMLVPEWFQVQSAGQFSDDLPLAAYILLMSAIQISEMESALQEEEGPITFKRSALAETIIDHQDWIEIYHTLQIPGIQPADQIPVEEYIQLLEGKGYLQKVDNDLIGIGPLAAPLQEAYADPNFCRLTLSFEGINGQFPETGVLIHGNGRLFLNCLSANGVLSIKQLQNQQIAAEWAADLLAKGASVKHDLPKPPEISLDQLPEQKSRDAASIPLQDKQTSSQPKSRKYLIWVIVLIVILLFFSCACLLLFGDEILWHLGII